MSVTKETPAYQQGERVYHKPSGTEGVIERIRNFAWYLVKLDNGWKIWTTESKLAPPVQEA